MDNRLINIVSQGQKDLELALALALSSRSGHERRPTHYKELKLTVVPGEQPQSKENSKEGVITLVLLEGNKEGGLLITDGMGILPFNSDSQLLQKFVTEWLSRRRLSEYSMRLDHNGSNGRGWRVFTDFWGHVAGHQYAVCGIQPVSAWYGK